MRACTIVLTLAGGLGLAGMVAAEESAGSWWSRTFKMPWSKTADTKKDPKKIEPPPGPSLRERQTKVDADLQRRQEVCLRLQEIALRLGDDARIRQAEELDQRAFDAHKAASERIRQPEPARTLPDAKKKEPRK